MKVLVYRWNVYHLEKIIDALKKLGCEISTKSAPKEKYDDDENFKNQVILDIKEESPDWVFTVNYYGTVSDGCEEMSVPYVSWTCDSPLIAMYHQSVFNKCNFIFIFDKVQYVYFKQMGVENVYYLPLASDIKACEEAQNIKDKAFTSEISFVGSLYSRNAYDGIADKLSPYLRGYFDAAFNAQADIFGENIFDRLLTADILEELSRTMDFKQSERSFSDIGLVFNTTFLGFKMARHERIGCLSLLGQKYEVKLYTDENLFIPGVKNMGSVNYNTDMAKVFAQSKLNLNLTIRNIRSGIPLRVWDILGCKGFCLTNFQAEFLDLLENGKDLVWFDGLYDLQKKADFYLEHDEQRAEIAHNGFENVKKNHTYENRIKVILEVLNNATK